MLSFPNERPQGGFICTLTSRPSAGDMTSTESILGGEIQLDCKLQTAKCKLSIFKGPSDDSWFGGSSIFNLPFSFCNFILRLTTVRHNGSCPSCELRRWLHGCGQKVRPNQGRQ